MSDIYLQITETPAVVTLSAPVVSGALASTVTVANTVTVALDANSLSALENVTVTVGAAITGTVTVANFPATQAVSLSSVPTHGVTLASTTVTVSSLPAISGTVTANAGANFAGEIYNGIFNFSDNNQIGVYVTDALPTGTNRIGVVTIGAGTVTIGAGTAQIGNIDGVNSVLAVYDGQGDVFGLDRNFPIDIISALPAGTNRIGVVTIGGGTVTIGSLPALAAGTAQIGSVTASISANPSGALTTRFGSVTTANTAQITTAVTNTSRKYLFAQNISIGIVTMGIGFSPTTTQGIQLSAGSGIVFDSFCPTGAVYWLGATTGAAWSILEG